MLVGEAQGLFCERATPIGRGLLEKKYIFQVCACDEDGQQHFRNLSRLYPGLRFVYVYGWDGWNEYSYGQLFNLPRPYPQLPGACSCG